MRLSLLAAAAAFLAAAPAIAQTPPRPKLIVAISIDQFSANLYREFRPQFTGGLARLSHGVVFARGFQPHAATETCPGHSTELTGNHPTHTGIVANDWIDFAAPREDKIIYCVDDETAPGSSSTHYTVTASHLKVPTLGDRMKAADPRSRVVAVSGKDRAAVMMGGHAPDQSWYWNGSAYIAYPGTVPNPVAVAVNASVADALSRPRDPLTLPAFCQPKDRAIPIGGGKNVGTFHFDRAAGDRRAFQYSPEFDGATLAMAAALFRQMQLGKGPAPDLLAVSLSATDYVGHRYGTEGAEMCLQLMSLDADLDGFLKLLDASGIDYVVELTADHGGLDLPERARSADEPQAQRLLASGTPETIGAEVARRLRLPESVFKGEWYLVPSVPQARRPEVLALAKQLLMAQGQVEAVFTRVEVAATPIPTVPPENWSLIERFRASYDAQRSADLFVAYKPYVTPIVDPTIGNVATHGSVWDYDRTVPILFWWKGIAHEEESGSAMTVDILPTLASLIGLSVPQAEIDGHCRDIIAGPESNCH